MRTIFILISNPLFRLSRPSRFVLPFWFSHCFFIESTQKPHIYSAFFAAQSRFFIHFGFQSG